MTRRSRPPAHAVPRARHLHAPAPSSATTRGRHRPAPEEDGTEGFLGLRHWPAGLAVLGLVGALSTAGASGRQDVPVAQRVLGVGQSPWQEATARAFDAAGGLSSAPPLPVSVAPPASSTRVDTARTTSTAVPDDVRGIPARVLAAYRAAESRLDVERPGCALPWTLLAGIGRVESGHASFGGGVVAATGRVQPAIIGVRLGRVSLVERG